MFDLKAILPLGTEVEPDEYGTPHDVYLKLLCHGRKLLDDLARQLRLPNSTYADIAEAVPRPYVSDGLLSNLSMYAYENCIELQSDGNIDAFRRAFLKTIRMVYPDFCPEQKL